MGQHADDALDETIDAEGDRLAFRMGMLSTFDAIELGIVDETTGELYMPRAVSSELYTPHKPRKAERSTMPIQTPPACQTPMCSSKAAVQCRGLCMRCYSQAKKLVEMGQVTWDDLEAKGVCSMEETPFMKNFTDKFKRS